MTVEGGVYHGNIFLFIVYKIGEIYGRLASEEKLTQDDKIESFYSLHITKNNINIHQIWV